MFRFHRSLIMFLAPLLAACNLIGQNDLPPDVASATVSSSVRYVDPALGLISIAPVSSGIEAVSYTGQTRFRRTDGAGASVSDIRMCSTINASGVRDGRELRANEITLVQVAGAPTGTFRVDTKVTRTDLRETPSTGARALASLPLRASLSVHGRCGDWIAVRTANGQEGWVTASSTTLTSAARAQLPVLPEIIGRVPANPPTQPPQQTGRTPQPGASNDLQINGVIEAVNTENRTLTVTVMGLRNLVGVTDSTRLGDSQGRALNLTDIRSGMPVQVRGLIGPDQIIAQEIVIQVSPPSPTTAPPVVIRTPQPGVTPPPAGGSVELAVVIWGVDQRLGIIYTDPLHMGDVVRLSGTTSIVFDNGQPASLDLLEVGMRMHVSGRRDGETIWADSIIVEL